MEHYSEKQKIFLLAGVRYLIVLTFIVFFFFSVIIFNLPLTQRFYDFLFFALCIITYNTIGIILLKRKIAILPLTIALTLLDIAVCFIFWVTGIFESPGMLDFLFFIFSGFPALASILGPRFALISFGTFILTGISIIFLGNREDLNFGTVFFLLWESFFFSFIVFFIGYVTKLEKESKKEVMKLNEQLELANRYKNQFLAIVSHEFKTPINSITGFTKCILDGLDGPVSPDQESSLKKVIHSADNLLQLINDLLDLSKIEAGKLVLEYSTFALPDCIDDAISSTTPLYTAKGLTVTRECPPVSMRSDYKRLRQIMINLISNATKFTSRGAIQIQASASDGRVEISVSDRGIGIPEDLLPHIFDEFSTSKRGGGTGLGLSITKRFVELLHGKIQVESKVNEGSKFTFNLPQEVNDEVS